MRIPLAVNLESRDGTLDQDALVKNGIIERNGDGLRLRKRPGLLQHHDGPATGVGQCLFYWRGIKAIVDDKYLWLSSAHQPMNSARKGTNVTLSNGDLTVSMAGAGSVYSVNDWSLGEISYFEVTIGSAGGAQRIGVGTYAAGDINGAPGADAGPRVKAYSVDGKVYTNNAVETDTTVTATAGDVIGVSFWYVSGTGTTLKFFKNGTEIYSDTTGPSAAGANLAVLGSAAGGGSMTVNFGQTAFAYSVPEGPQFVLTVTDADLRFWAQPTNPSATTQRVLFHNGVEMFYQSVLYPQNNSTAIVGITEPVTPLAAGIGYLDGYFCVMGKNGKISISGEEDPTTWGALDFLYADSEPGDGKFIGKSLTYIVALKEYSTELFYNAGNPTGSVLSPVPSGLTLVGCASGESAAVIDENVIWISQTRDGKRGVHLARGLANKKVSTEAVDRILAMDSLSDVRAYAIPVDGHALYVLTLVASAVTLVYDLTSDEWTQWTSLTAAANKSVTSITRSGTTATVTVSGGHGMSDGDPVTIAGANQSGYNITAQIAYVSSTVFTIEVDSGTVSPATGTITATPYTESYFDPAFAADCAGVRLLLGATNGETRQLPATTYRDDGLPINFFGRTTRLDGGTTDPKKLSRIGVIGDKVSDTAMIRWSDDDSTSFTKYRRVTLSNATPELRRCGAFDRRSIEFRHIGNTAPVIDALELDIGR